MKIFLIFNKIGEMAIYRCLLRILTDLVWKSRSEMLSRQGFQLPESLRTVYLKRDSLKYHLVCTPAN